jgi:hypothetical protein
MPTTLQTTVAHAPSLRPREQYAVHRYQVDGVPFPGANGQHAPTPVEVSAVVKWDTSGDDYCSVSLNLPCQILPEVTEEPAWWDGEAVTDRVVHFRGMTRAGLAAWRDILSQALSDMDATRPQGGV